MDVQTAFSDAFQRTRFLLFEKRGLRRWASFAVLNMFGGSAGGGGGIGFPTGLPSMPSRRGQVGLGAAALGCAAAGSNLAPEVLLLIGSIGLGVLLFGLAMAWISSVCRVILVENIIYDRDALLEPFARLTRLGSSIFFWTLALMLAMAVPALVLAVPMAGHLSQLPSSPEKAMEELLPLVFGLFAVLLPLMLVSLVVFTINNELVVPVMYHDDVTVIPGWRRVLQIMAASPKSWLLFLFVRLGLGLCCTVLEGILAVICFCVLALVLALPAIALCLALGSAGGDWTIMLLVGVLCAICLFLVGLPAMLAIGTPFTVFLRCFSMYCLQAAAPQYLLLQPGGRDSLLQTTEVTTGFNPAN